MNTQLSLISLLVKDYDEAIDFFIQKLGFLLLEDTHINSEKRWVRILPGKNSTCGILLAKAVNEQQLMAVGNQSGGRVFMFLNTDDFDADHNLLIENKVKIIRPPTLEPYGKVLVFADLYGNLWDLIEPLRAIKP